MKEFLTVLLLTLVYNVGTEQVPRIDPLVETRLGLVRGTVSDDGTYAKFLGIPYAVVDEDQPFAPSVPHQGFQETFNAYDGTIVCPQFGNNGPRGQIQCLNLNVYVPNSASSQNPLPVMVYIHGGAFEVGSGGTEMGTPDHLLKKDVIYVSINYRLGVYGFICTDSPKAPGNIGLKDQLLALRWIKENIESFGGNPNKVTVFGESAGGMSIHLHILSPHEQLFEGAIIQSGPATSPLSFVELDNGIPLRLSAALGYDTENVDEAIDFIARADVDLVIAAASSIKSDTIYEIEPLTKACVENEFEGIERFVTANPNELKPEKAKDIPIIIGFTTQEMIFQHGYVVEDFFDRYTFGDLLSFGFKVDDADEMIDDVRKFYIGDTPPSIELVNEITSCASDFTFNHPTEKAIQNMLDVEPKAIYHYLMSYEGTGNYFNRPFAIDIEGVGHTSEMMYLLDSPFVNAADHEEFIDRIVTIWTNFAKYGDPTPEISDLLPVKWEPVTKDSRPYLNLNRDLTIKTRPFHDRMAFWDLFYKVNAKRTIWYKEEEGNRNITKCTEHY